MIAPLVPDTVASIRSDPIRVRFARLPAALALAGLVAASGCAHVPELDARISPQLQSAPYPALLPLDTALEPLPSPQQASDRIESALAGRRDRLKARAARLQAPVIDDASRARMAAGLSL